MKLLSSLRERASRSCLIVLLFGASPAMAESVDPSLLRELQALIQQQQAQIQRQSEQLRRQAEALDALQRQMQSLMSSTEAAQAAAQEAQTKASRAEILAESAGQGAGDRPVSSGQDRIKLAISGQINRMVNVADDGGQTTSYHVDNVNSSSRVRFVGTGGLTEDLTLGAVMEAELRSNPSTEVSQRREDTGTANFRDRRVEAYLDSKRFGRLWLGKGWTASDATSEVDLSGTSVIGYSAIELTAGGLFFRDKDSGVLTNSRIGDVFFNFDGLGRQDRVRYDTPTWRGFTLAGSVIEDQQWDAALRWSGQGYGLQAAGAAAVSDPANDDLDLRYNGSFSVLDIGTGLSFTAAAGLDDRKRREDSSFWYVKGGWESQALFDFGSTALSLDYATSSDIELERDDGESVGAYLVQRVANYGTQVFAGLRYHDLDRDDLRTESIWVSSFGTRVKF